MARITVEDCLNNVDNRFELVLVSSKRARQLMSGTKEAQIDWENDKATVVALREIEQGLVGASILEEEEHDDYFDDKEPSGFGREPSESSDSTLELAALMNGLSAQIAGGAESSTTSEPAIEVNEASDPPNS